MCIVLHKKAGVTLSRQTYLNCFNSNRDGAGFAFAENGKLEVRKGFFDFDQFYDAFKSHEHRDAVVHFRIGTSAPKDAFNCHPWVVTDCHKGFEFAVAHNGILSYPHSEHKSDTGHFVDEILGPQLRRDPWFLDHKPGQYLVEEMLGAGNKMVVLRSDGTVYVLNRKHGVEEEGVWYSNNGYKNSFGHRGFGWCSAGDDDDMDWRRRGRFGTDERYPTLALTEEGDTYEVAPATGGKTLLPHLTRRERLNLFALAAKLYGDEGLTGMELIEHIRDRYLDLNPDKSMMPVEELDREISRLTLSHDFTAND